MKTEEALLEECEGVVLAHLQNLFLIEVNHMMSAMPDHDLVLQSLYRASGIMQTCVFLKRAAARKSETIQ